MLKKINNHLFSALAIVIFLTTATQVHAQTGGVFSSFWHEIATIAGSIVADRIPNPSTEETAFGAGFSSPKITSASTASSSFLPSSNNALDLGAYGSAWRDTYVSGTAQVNNLTVTGTCTGCSGAATLSGGIADSLTFWNSSIAVSASSSLTYSSSTGLFSNLGTVSSTAINTGNITAKNNNLFDVGAFGSAFKDVYVSGTARVQTVSVIGSLAPATNNAIDSGAFGSAWRDFYSSGTARLGTLSNDGNTTLGDSSADTITLNARFASTLNPNANNTLDLGTFGTAWKDIYASGTLRIGTGTVIDGTTLTLAAASGFNVGKFFVDASGNVNASGTVRTASGITTGGTIQPIANNTTDIGAFGSAFKDVYVSGSIRVGSGAASTTLSSNGNILSTGNQIPATNNTSDEGAFGSAWRDIYSSGTTRLGTLSTDGNVTLGDSTADTVTFNGQVASTINPSTNNSFDLGTFGNAFRNINASGTLQVGGNMTLGDNATVDTLTVNARYASTIQPTSNNVRALGAFGFAWSNVFASGTAFVNNVSSSNITASSLAATAAGDVNLCISTTGVFTQGSSCGVSSMYYKENIQPLKPEEILRKVMQIQSVMFTYGKNAEQGQRGMKDEGFIAEHIASIDPLLADWRESTPEHVEWTEKNFPKLVRVNDKGKKEVPDSVRYDRVSILTVAALQAQQAQIDQERTIRENQVNAINARLDKQESLITKLFKIIEKILTKLHF